MHVSTFSEEHNIICLPEFDYQENMLVDFEYLMNLC